MTVEMNYLRSICGVRRVVSEPTSVYLDDIIQGLTFSAPSRFLAERNIEYKVLMSLGEGLREILW